MQDASLSSAKYVKAWRKRNIARGLTREGKPRLRWDRHGLSVSHRKVYMRAWRLRRKMRAPQTVSEAVRKLNPHIYGHGQQGSHSSLDTVSATKRKPDSIQALDQGPKMQRSRKGGVAVCVTIIALSNRLPDDDNWAAAAKTLRDSIARSIGVDDGDRRVRWQYGTVETRGEEGVVVTIETL